MTTETVNLRIVNTGRKLDIGSGAKYEDSWETMDLSPAYHPDFQHDITAFPWPFEDDTFEHLRCWHVLEHLERKHLIPVMNEMHRVAKPNGELSIEVPIFPFFTAMADPTHVSFFVQQTWDYFTIGGGHEEHMALYGIKPWEFIERHSVDDGRIKRVTLRKPKED